MSERQFHKDLRMFLMQLSIYSYEGRDPFAKGLCADALASIPQWISVEERLPDEEQHVLAYWPATASDDEPWISVAWVFEGDKWQDLEVELKSPSHWMPLPEPPEVK